MIESEFSKKLSKEEIEKLVCLRRCLQNAEIEIDRKLNIKDFNTAL